MFTRKKTNDSDHYRDHRAELRSKISAAIDDAIKGHIHVSEAADIAEQCAVQARTRDAMTKPIM